MTTNTLFFDRLYQFVCVSSKAIKLPEDLENLDVNKKPTVEVNSDYGSQSDSATNKKHATEHLPRIEPETSNVEKSSDFLQSTTLVLPKEETHLLLCPHATQHPLEETPFHPPSPFIIIDEPPSQAGMPSCIKPFVALAGPELLDERNSHIPQYSSDTELQNYLTPEAIFAGVDPKEPGFGVVPFTPMQQPLQPFVGLGPDPGGGNAAGGP